MQSPLIVQNLNKTYSSGSWPFSKHTSFTAVNNISFELKQNEILGMLGPNGAGKTTTIQMLLGLLTPTSGGINYFGKDFNRNRTEILKQVTFASGFETLPARLSIWENLDVYSRLYGVPHAQRVEQLNAMLRFFDLWNMRDKPTGSLSAGQMTRVALAKAFIPRPAIVLLDEPSAALDPNVAHEVRHFILEQKKQYGTSILFTSHNMDEVTDVCDRVVILKNGSIFANDTPALLAASIAIARVHLLITEGMDILTTYVKQHLLGHTVDNQEITISIDEHSVGAMLVTIARLGVAYSQISIEKPDLEDYFLSIAK